MKTHGVKADHITYTIAIASACTPGGYWREALQFLDEAKLTMSSSNGMSSMGSDSCNINNATDVDVEITEAMLPIFNATIACCANGGAWQQGLQLLKQLSAHDDVEKFSRRGLLHKAYGAALSGCERAGAWQAALNTLDECKRLEIVDSHCYSAVITALRRGCSGTQSATSATIAKKVYEIFDEARLNGHADTIVYDSTVQALSSAGDYHKAIDIVREMKILKMVRHRSTCNAIVRACIAASCPRVAAKALIDLFPITTTDEKVHGAITPAYLEHVSSLLDQHETLSGNVVSSSCADHLPPFTYGADNSAPYSWAEQWNKFCPADGGTLANNIEGRAVESLRSLVKTLFSSNGEHGETEVQVYGSWAEGVALRHSDVDTS